MLLIVSMVLFLVARDSYPGLIAVMAVSGLGVGSAYAVNPLQITAGVPAAETGSAISFYQLVRTVAYAIASALSATVLVLSTPAGAPVSRGRRLQRRRRNLHRRPGRRAGRQHRFRLDILPA